MRGGQASFPIEEVLHRPHGEVADGEEEDILDGG